MNATEQPARAQPRSGTAFSKLVPIFFSVLNGSGRVRVTRPGPQDYKKNSWLNPTRPVRFRTLPDRLHWTHEILRTYWPDPWAGAWPVKTPAYCGVLRLSIIFAHLETGDEHSRAVKGGVRVEIPFTSLFFLLSRSHRFPLQFFLRPRPYSKYYQVSSSLFFGQK